MPRITRHTGYYVFLSPVASMRPGRNAPDNPRKESSVELSLSVLQ